MPETVRWGILGASNFARNQLVPALHAAERCEVVAIASREPDGDRATSFRRLVPDLRIDAEYEAILAADDIDAVYVPLPNHLHVEWTVEALEAGKHVLCEKPIAMVESDFDRLIAARDSATRHAAEAFMIVHHPQWQRARELLNAGRVGRLRHVEVVFSYHNPDPDNIRNQVGKGGGGLRDIGVYAFGSVRYATGQEPVDLTATLDMVEDHDTFAEINASFPEFSYHAVVSTLMALRQRVVFHGEDATIELTAPFNAGVFDQAELIIEAGSDGRIVERWPRVDQYVLQAENFAATVLDGADYPWPLEAARGSQTMIDRAFASGVGGDRRA